MESEENACLVYTTFPDMASAKRVGGELVDRRLVACTNILPGMISIYQWEGAREMSEEVVVIFKTREGRVGEVVSEIERLHPYDTPAVLTFPASGGSAGYIAWIHEMSGATPPSAG